MKIAIVKDCITANLFCFVKVVQLLITVLMHATWQPVEPMQIRILPKGGNIRFPATMGGSIAPTFSQEKSEETQ